MVNEYNHMTNELPDNKNKYLLTITAIIMN